MTALPYNTAVRQFRASLRPGQAARQPWEDLDLYCTPPWATRALMHIVLPRLGEDLQHRRILEPACGLGHMSDVLKERARYVHASDIFDYGCGHKWDFLNSGLEFPAGADWTITNPPFKLAENFALTALRPLGQSRCGVALLVRSAWLEGGGRWKRLFNEFPPTVVAQFVERVPMVKGRWNPQAKTATAYCWVVWSWRHAGNDPSFMHIPPCRAEMSRPYDFDVFAHRRPPAIVGAP
jgi:hypothetical protein